ncbi:MAG: extradiol dioxygenase [Gemmatimonadetes bacterium]|nr:extradiol dioxygenase [Gemmatimonadota bacterium]
MIKGMHGMFYSSKPEALRAFIRDKLGVPARDIGEGWLIFDLPKADLGVHPTEGDATAPSGTHDISFFCDDLKATVAELRGRGVEFKDEIRDDGWGFTIRLDMPGGIEMQIYQPKF